eukprot:3650623-Amphidinium_carterae.2
MGDVRLLLPSGRTGLQSDTTQVSAQTSPSSTQNATQMQCKCRASAQVDPQPTPPVSRADPALLPGMAETHP